MPKCRVCKQPIIEGSRFCGQCGTPVDASAPPTQLSLPSYKNPNKILILIVGVLSIALVAVSFLKTGAIPTPWTQKSQTSSTITPTSIVQAPTLRNPSLPYRLSCNCKTPEIALTITKISIAPEAGQIWSLSFQNISSKYIKYSLPYFSLQDSSNPKDSSNPNNTYQAIGDVTPNYACPISLNPGQTTPKVVAFFFIPLAHIQYELTTRFYACGGNSYLDFITVPFTFS